ncbi:hypothetical protein P7K49_019563 [Saguinus oedipus]|uniref:Uncharacterized protein n=1 Tax=Saguinus oedipus TaxID=9490 RepID=A0ABQ9UY23_SAGOE|nr:hypothetical protein P7K49_019563 [Saguinus oedipus]
MASLLPSGFPVRTNSRLDVFLQRHLSPEVYDAVRACERCIVVSNSENHTLKYVVLSDRFIYLTENPPKSIRRVVALRDVVAIDLVSARVGSGLESVVKIPGWGPQTQPSCARGEGRPAPSHPRLPYSCLRTRNTGKLWIAVSTPNTDTFPMLLGSAHPFSRFPYPT